MKKFVDDYSHIFYQTTQEYAQRKFILRPFAPLPQEPFCEATILWQLSTITLLVASQFRRMSPFPFINQGMVQNRQKSAQELDSVSLHSHVLFAKLR
jgi:hypothetical protein